MEAVGTIEMAIPKAALTLLRALQQAKYQDFPQAAMLVLMGMNVGGGASYDLDRGVVTIVRAAEPGPADPDA